jgi:hypothetical protein
MVEINKSRLEDRSIRTQPVSPEQIGFPLVAQAARVLRKVTGREDENIALITSASPDRLDAPRWLKLNRAGFGGIENGLHQRLDVSQNDDRCRIRDSNGIWVIGMVRRLANSLLMEWLSHQPHPEYKTTTDFQSAMAEEHRQRAVRIVLSKRPNFGPS